MMWKQKQQWEEFLYCWYMEKGSLSAILFKKHLFYFQGNVKVVLGLNGKMNGKEISNTHFSKAIDSDITAYLIDLTHILLNFIRNEHTIEIRISTGWFLLWEPDKTESVDQDNSTIPRIVPQDLR